MNKILVKMVCQPITFSKQLTLLLKNRFPHIGSLLTTLNNDTSKQFRRLV